jgi:hypothetical protein
MLSLLFARRTKTPGGCPGVVPAPRQVGGRGISKSLQALFDLMYLMASPTVAIFSASSSGI